MRRMGRLLAGGVVALLLAVCSVACSLIPLRPATSPSDSGDSHWLVSRLTAVVAAGDRAGYDALFTGDADAGIRGWIWTNLRLFPGVNFSTDSAGNLVAAWRSDLDSLPIKNRVGSISCVDATGCRVTDLGPQPGVVAPIWAVQPLQVARQGTVQVLAPVSGAGLVGWMSAAQAAQKTLAGLPLGQLKDNWDGNAVVEFPVDANAFAQRFGETSPAAYVNIGAITQLQAQFRDPGQGSVAWTKFTAHVVVNPMTTGGLTQDQQVFLLTHELVHVATSAWPIAAGATWVSEGLAESVAMDAVAGEGAKDWTSAKAACTATGLAVPGDDEYTSGDAKLQTAAYAVGGALVGLVRRHMGDAANDALLALRQGKPADGVDLATWALAWCKKSGE